MKLLNFGDSTLRESFEKKFPKIGVPWLLIKWLSIAALALLVAGLAALAYVFNLLDTAFSKVIRFTLESNIGAQEADIKYWVGTITFLLSFFILWLISNLWKHRYILVGLAVALFAFAYFSGVSSNKEVFGEGKDDRFMCPGPTPDHPQTISRTSKNPQAKLPCTKIYNPAEVAVATYLLQMQESKQPLQKPKIVPRFQMLFDDFELMKNGVQLVYKSKALDSEDMPIVYDRPGFDNIAGGLLVPVTLEDLAKIRAHIKQKIEEDQKKKDAAAKEKLDEERRVAAELETKKALEKAENDRKEKQEKTLRYSNLKQEVATLKEEKHRLEEEDNAIKRNGERSVQVARNDRHNRLIVNKGTYVSSVSKQVVVYVNGKKSVVSFNEDAFAELHDKGAKIELGAEGCWFCEGERAAIREIPRNKKRLQDISSTIAVNERELEELLIQLPELKTATQNKPQQPKSTNTTLVAQTSRVNTTTSTPGNEVVLIIRLIRRDPVKPFFEYEPGMRGNTVLSSSDGIRISSTGKACDSVKLGIDDSEPKGICSYHKNPIMVSAGSVYKIYNNTGKIVLGKVMRSEID